MKRTWIVLLWLALAYTAFAQCPPPQLLYKEHPADPSLEVYYWQDPACGQFFADLSLDGGATWERMQPTITTRILTPVPNQPGMYLIGPRYKSVTPSILPDGALVRLALHP